MAFDPLAHGAIPVEDEFDPLAHGAVPVDEPAQEPKTTQMEGAARGLLAGAGQDWQPQLAGAGAAALSFLGIRPDKSFGETFFNAEEAAKEYRSMRDAEEAATEQAAKDRPLAYGAGKFIGTLPAAIAAGGSASAAQRVGNMALLSGVQGAGASRADTAEGVLRDAGTAALIGGAAQGVGDKLFGWLGNKFLRKADERTLIEAGFTRQQHRNLARRMGDYDGYEQRLEDIVAAARKHGVEGHSPWEKVAQPLQDAKDAIGGQYAQATANAPGVQGLEATDVIQAYMNTAGKSASNLGESAAKKVGAEADYLLDKITRGELSPAEAHRWALDLKTRIFPGNGAPVPEGVDPQMMMRFRQELVEKMRARAEQLHPDGVERFRTAIREYGPLDDLNRAARQGHTRDVSWHSAWASIGHKLPYVGAAGSFALGGAMDHEDLGKLGAGGLAAYGLMSRSPTLLRAGAGALGSRLAGGLGRDAVLGFNSLRGFLGQPAAAERFSSGETTNDYTPHSTTP